MQCRPTTEPVLLEQRWVQNCRQGKKWSGLEAADVQRSLSAAGLKNVSVTPLPPDRRRHCPAHRLGLN
jgi:hypothetical protein